MLWLLIPGLLLVGASQLGAQTKAVTPTQSAAQVKKVRPPAPSSIWVKDPNSVMPMRQMTNTQRKAAAERTKARRAKAEARRRSRAASVLGVQQ
jgi:hypothetical protein